MSGLESNNDFFSYYGVVNRKNYIINMLIVSAIYIGLSVIKFESFAPFITYKFLYTALIFMINMIKFVAIMSALSLIYRRIADFSYQKNKKFQQVMYKIFVTLFVFPAIYLLILRYFIDIVPAIQNILDLLSVLILLPAGIISAIIFAFIKG